MIKFLADESFNNQIIRGILRQAPAIGIVRVQDVNLSGVDDPTVLTWAAAAGRIHCSNPRCCYDDYLCLPTYSRWIIHAWII